MINAKMLGGKARKYNTIDSGKTKFPQVKLMSINKALSRDTPDYHKKLSFLIKARTCCQVSMHLQVFLVANPFWLRSIRTRYI